MNSRRNRYLEDRAMRRSMRSNDYARGGRGRDYNYQMDGRNPYGSRGGYVRSDRSNGNYDSRMDYGNNYSEYDRGYDYRGSADYRRQDYNRYPEQYGEYRGTYDYGMRNDYNMNMDYDHMEKEYHEELKKWTEKLKQQDTRIRISKDQILRQAKNMNVKFNDYNEEEFYATYLMMISDFPNVTNDYNVYLSMAKNWLEDKDAKKQGSDKLCAYLYTIVLDKEEDDD